MRSRVLLLLALALFGCEQRTGEHANTKPAAEHGASASPANSEHHVRIAAAADLKFALDEVVSEFQKANPSIRVEVTYGSSGNFFAQLSNGAPYDVFLSADRQYPKKLIEAGHADGSTEFPYAVGQIVVWVLKASPLDVERLGLKALLEPAVKKIAIANPKHAPYGRAAQAALESSGLYPKVKDRLVLGENIAQTAQFAESGTVDVGIIAHSLAVAPEMRDKGRFWTVPQSAYPKIEQAGVVTKQAQDRDAALTFCRYLAGESGQKVLKQFGFAGASN